MIVVKVGSILIYDILNIKMTFSQKTFIV